MLINIYVLNLDHHAERLKEIKSNLNRQSLNWKRFPAIDGLKITEEVLDELTAPTGPIPRMTIGARACTASHLKILHAFLETDATHALILEDDAEISGSLANDLSKILKESPAGILNLNRQSTSRPVKKIVVKSRATAYLNDYQIHELCGIHYGTAGYIIDRESAKVVLAEYPRPDLPIDHMLFNPNVSRLFDKIQIKQLFPALVQPRTGIETSIQKSKVKGSNSLRNRLKRAKAEVSIFPRLLVGTAFGYYQVQNLEVKE